MQEIAHSWLHKILTFKMLNECMKWLKYTMWIKNDDWFIVKLKIAANPNLKEFFKGSKTTGKGYEGI